MEWQAQEVGFDFDAQGGGQGQGQARGKMMTTAARGAWVAWVAEYSVGLYLFLKR